MPFDLNTFIDEYEEKERDLSELDPLDIDFNLLDDEED